MSKSLRVGLVGCGAMGQAHLSVWQKIPIAQVTAICDPNLERAKSAGDPIGAVAFVGLEEMCASGLIDAIDISTPSGMHADQGMVGARHGLHVLVEKPVDLVIAKAEALVDACESAGVTLGCIFQRRTFTGAQQVVDAISQGKLGQILSINASVKWFRPQSYYDSAAWRGTHALDGGVLANQAIHALDHVCWLVGAPEKVEYAHCATVAHEMECEDFAVAVVRFKSGALGTIEATTCCSPDLCSRIELFGTKGSVMFEDATVKKFGIDGVDLLHTIGQPNEVIGGGSVPMSISLRGHEILFADFADAVLTGRSPMVSGRAALESVALLNMIYAASGQQIGSSK
ncbi:MAG: Gfo/Idh/MocA family oxidoreductase [Chthonomonadales bacterium]